MRAYAPPRAKSAVPHFSREKREWGARSNPTTSGFVLEILGSGKISLARWRSSLCRRLLEAHHNFVGGHGCFPERFLYLDHPYCVTQSTNDTLFKIEHAAIFWRGALTEPGWQQWPAVPQRTRAGHPRSSLGLQLKLRHDHTLHEYSQKQRARVPAPRRQGQRRLVIVFSHHRDLWADSCR